MMSHLKTIIKAVVSLGLLGYLLYLADPKQVLNVLDQVWYENGILYLSIAAVLFLLSLVVLSFRWQILVRGYGLNISTRLLFKYYLIGLFFNKLNCRERAVILSEHIFKKENQLKVFKIDSQEELNQKLMENYRYCNRCKMLLTYPNNPSLAWRYIQAG